MNPQAVHSALEPGGVQAAYILRLFYAYLDVAAVVFTLVLVALGFALGRKREPDENAREPSAAALVNKKRAVACATAASVAILLGLLLASVTTGHAMALLPAADAIDVEVIAHKWWWEFRYPVTSSATRFSTA